MTLKERIEKFSALETLMSADFKIQNGIPYLIFAGNPPTFLNLETGELNGEKISYRKLLDIRSELERWL